MNVTVTMTPAEAEALLLFLADREELWRLHATTCGVPDPMALPVAITDAHRMAVRRTAAGATGGGRSSKRHPTGR